MNVDSTYFDSGIMLVPNQTSIVGGVTLTSNKDELNKYIARYGVAFMKRLLGSLYEDYTENPTSEKWVALNAKLFDTTLKISPIANYVFFFYYNQSTRRNTGAGVTVQKVENAVTVTNGRLCEVWNEMVSMMTNGVDGVLDWLSESAQVETYQFDHTTTKWNEFTSYMNELGI